MQPYKHVSTKLVRSSYDGHRGRLGDTAASMEIGSAARFEIQLLRTELAAAESAAAQWFERSALSTTCVLSSMVEVDVAESMVAEALQIGDEQAAAAAASHSRAAESTRCSRSGGSGGGRDGGCGACVGAAAVVGTGGPCI